MQKTIPLLAVLALSALLSACAVGPATEPAPAPTAGTDTEAPIDLWQPVAEAFEQAAGPAGVEVAVEAAGLRLSIPAADGFASGRDELQPALVTSLHALVAPLGAHPELAARIVGHTDSVGREGYNMLLSRQRARAVREFFMAAGIDPLRLSAEGRGEMDPVADNDTDAGRARNRRVEIHLYRPDGGN